MAFKTPFNAGNTANCFPLRDSKAFALKAATKLFDNWRIAWICHVHIRDVTLAGYR
ncbi:hypothetical protein BROSI_A0973 [Candidatus Brocadia sinica JPN1]|uniref:Uncharacterized protein n=1 Tax=Candidatus Brocadia sinica JPN1 TaxID=1197129 RepID=A0ABQ0JUT1_9BACT|nr:hypothetical protein BROSI_A0973 [Candidatus Brocadia sinica JPN1]